MKKFVEQFIVEDFEILTDEGYVDVIGSHKTKKFKVWFLITENKFIKCAGKHIVFDENLDEIYVEDLKIGDIIFTSSGFEKVIKVYQTDEEDHMFDLQLDENSKHRYFTNGILSHNTNIGKTLILCHTVADLLAAGHNVVYFTAEMSEKRIAQRVDANLLDHNVKDLADIDKKAFFKKLKDLYHKTSGTLYFKEYPTSTANILHMKAYLDELKLKKNFRPDFVVVDYLNIFTSARVPASRSLDTYGYVKAITEEMRSLCSMEDVGKPGEGIGLITATQTNRGGSKNNAETMDNTDTAESYGAPMTVDWQGGIIQTPELFKQGKYVLKVLKSRFDDNINEVYTIGVDRSRMRLYELDDDQKEIPIHVKDRLRREKEKENMGEGGFDFEFNE